MWWKLTRSEFARNAGEKNKRLMKRITESGEVSGLLAYADGEPIGWCSVAPREAYPVLDRSPTLKRIDDKPAWSVVCFFVAKRFRSRGVTGFLLQAAISYAREHGAELIEGYPIEPKRTHRLSSSEGFTGIASIFRKAGFSEAVRRSKNRPIMRRYLRR